MKLFKRKEADLTKETCGCKEETKESCCSFDANKVTDPTIGASVKVLGTGCPKCNTLETNTIEALKELNMDTTIEHITDYSEIASYGVMSTPALYVDGKIVAFGKAFSKEEIIEILKNVRG